MFNVDKQPAFIHTYSSHFISLLSYSICSSASLVPEVCCDQLVLSVVMQVNLQLLQVTVSGAAARQVLRTGAGWMSAVRSASWLLSCCQRAEDDQSRAERSSDGENAEEREEKAWPGPQDSLDHSCT